jgi:Flp pilus assembly protein TadD
MRPAASRSAVTRSVMVGAVGAFVAWLVQTSVDWMQLLPGLTAIAIAAAAVIVRPHRLPRPAGATSRNPRFGKALAGRPALALGASAVVVTLVIAGASLSRQGLADLYLARAQNELNAHPAAAITDANRSLDIDSDDVETYYAKAAALARFDQAASAQAVLREALEHEPNNFVTWTLLGDISLRERRIGAARRDYNRAHELNPRDATLRALAANPSTGLQ